MKHLLLLTMLVMFVLGGAQSALAAPYAFGPSSFDDQVGLKVNLETLVGNGTRIQEVHMNPGQILGFSYFKLMAASDAAVNANFTMLDSSNTPVTSAASAAADWDSTLSGNLADYKIKYDGGPAGGISLDSAFKMAYTFGDDIVYQPENMNGVIVKGGTFFLGLSLPGSQGVDFVMAFSNAPFAPAVPVPAAVWLMGTGLAGLVALRKRANLAKEI